MTDCGCDCGGDCADPVQAAQQDVFKTPQEAMKRAKELGCDTVHTHRHDGETLFMPCSGMKEYEEKMSEKKAYIKEEDIEGMSYDDEEEEKKASYHTDGDCKPGYEKKDGMCVRVAVTCELEIEDVSVIVEATSGMSVIRMSGVAFTSGYNKNGWQITKAGAKELKEKMIGADITLNHPKTKAGRFTRNMTGGIDEAVVGIITDAKYHDEEDDKYKVKFTGEVYREELFSALESGLWLRAGYGVSIGGTGIPIATEEDEKGRMKMTFESDFDFDHLAIVHKPAYQDAKIESAERVQLEIEASESTTPLIYRKGDSPNQHNHKEIQKMSEEEITISASEEELALKEKLVLAEAKIAAFEAAEAEAKEASRLELVSKATEMGLSGVDEFSSEMLERVIASWEASRPAPKEMIPAAPASQEAVVEATETPESREVVANFLNGERIESDKVIYGKAWNAWASAWNGNLSSVDKELRAPMFDEIKEMI